MARRGWRRRALAVGGSVLLTVACVEGVSWAVYRVVAGRSFDFEALERARGERLGAEAAPAERPLPPYVANKALHPYQGYVADARDAHGRPRPNISEYGFVADASPLRVRGPDRIVVGILGASVAMGFAHSPAAREALERGLDAVPALAGRTVDLVPIALPGYHQPQQLLTLSYLLSLGAEFDLVVNIDGFNEVAIDPAENARLGVFHAFPRAWSLLVAGSEAAGADAYRYAVEQRRRAAERLSRSLLRRSVAANVAWWLWDRRIGGEIATLRDAVLEGSERAASYAASGPPRPADRPGPMQAELVALWQRSSRQLARLCEANDIRYYHVLQPNQYDVGSKRLTDEERRLAFEPRHVYRPGAEHGYPRLREAGAALAREGIRFLDLSGVFSESDETLYVDSCCHFNEAGFALLAGALTEGITADLTEQPLARP